MAVKAPREERSGAGLVGFGGAAVPMKPGEVTVQPTAGQRRAGGFLRFCGLLVWMAGSTAWAFGLARWSLGLLASDSLEIVIGLLILGSALFLSAVGTLMAGAGAILEGWLRWPGEGRWRPWLGCVLLRDASVFNGPLTFMVGLGFLVAGGTHRLWFVFVMALGAGMVLLAARANRMQGELERGLRADHGGDRAADDRRGS